jgi:hypothetical protein
MLEHNPPSSADHARASVFPPQLHSMSRVNSFSSSTTGDSPAADSRSVG